MELFRELDGLYSARVYGSYPRSVFVRTYAGGVARQLPLAVNLP